MSLLEDVVINTKSAINTFSKKAGEFVDNSKLKINAAEIQNDISKKFEKIGELVYNSGKNNSNPDSQIEVLKNQIDYLLLKLNNINEQIATMKKKCKCKECGFLNEQNSNYCCKCGSKIECSCCCCDSQQNNEDQQEKAQSDSTSAQDNDESQNQQD